MDAELAELVKVVTPDHEEWEERCSRWNLFSEEQEDVRVIAVPKDTDDVVKIVNWAREHKQTSIGARSGGHALFSAAKVVVDMRDGFNYATVDTSNEVELGYAVATIGLGQTLGQLDDATDPYHMPVGVVSHTGCGLLLTGGVGYMCKARGASADNIIEVTIVTSDGLKHTCSADSESDLFFGVRGAAPNLGVVTEVKAKVYKQPEAFVSLCVWPNTYENAKMLVDWADQETVLNDNNITPYLGMIPSPDLGAHLCTAHIVCLGDDDDKYRELIGQLEDTPGYTPLIPPSRVPWSTPQTCFDTSFARQYWYVTQQHFPRDKTISPECLKDMVEAYNNTPLDPTRPIIIFEQRGNKASPYHQAPSDSCAQPRFDQRWECYIFYGTADKENAETVRQQGRAVKKTLLKYAKPGGRCHFTKDEPGHIEFYYGPNSEKLRQVVAKYDPHRLFASCNGMEF